MSEMVLCGASLSARSNREGAVAGKGGWLRPRRAATAPLRSLAFIQQGVMGGH